MDSVACTNPMAASISVTLIMEELKEKERTSSKTDPTITVNSTITLPRLQTVTIGQINQTTKEDSRTTPLKDMEQKKEKMMALKADARASHDKILTPEQLKKKAEMKKTHEGKGEKGRKGRK